MADVQEKPVMLIAVDDSEHSFFALQWALQHFFIPYAPNYPFKLSLINAKPYATSAIGMARPGAAEVLLYVEADLKRISARVIVKSKELCTSKGIVEMFCVRLDLKRISARAIVKLKELCTSKEIVEMFCVRLWIIFMLPC